ncbi:uncharacterized protein A1O9_10836 [Exophiala aquamarina CBS 119918]|uniref:Uncharacterized protein n=1 Tax=Exophiala aquamarina CBS 119918 TaxID=1182545 RepID=A0A072PBI9_9EURO|nr:uncharacterized protein A1O9_10836 [Exophiala aquamarina CBS 119918]KEF52930.1 hypothetical protein A1O9_10836 [Exophiala aquamarina CBS 119918]
MVKFFTQIEPDLAEWAMKQPVFFVASAPLKGKHINLSPKGLPSSSFSILTPNQCAYVDATGSGIETISHIQENGRCTVMFCSFETSPRIMRFFCTGRVVAWNEPGFDGWLKRMGGKTVTGARAVVVLDVYKAQTSCGFAVPYLAVKPDPQSPTTNQIAYLEDRNTLGHWAGKQIENGVMNDYRANWNRRSLDGLPGLRVARKDFGESLWLGDVTSQVRKRNGVHMALVAVFSSLATVVALWLWGVLRLREADVEWFGRLRGLNVS